MYEEGIGLPSEPFLAIADTASNAMLDAVSKPGITKRERPVSD